MSSTTATTLATASQLTTMTTVEIAELTGKEHFHVMRDTAKMLVELYGNKDLSIYGWIYKDAYGRDQRCYSLPKAEVLCLVSGYSAPLRMKIIRRLEDLEGEQSATDRNTIPVTPESVLGDLKATVEMAKIFGLEGNQALLSANTAIKKLHGLDCMSLIGVTNLVSESQVQYFTPTVIGKPHGLSAIKVNKALEAGGLQASRRDHKGKLVWEVTDKGKAFSEVSDTNKKHSDGSPIQQIKWAMNALDGIA
jgi:hypothetical protein